MAITAEHVQHIAPLQEVVKKTERLTRIQIQHLRYMALQGSETEKIEVAGFERLPGGVQAILVKSRSETLLLILAKRQKIAARIQIQLAKSDYISVRKALAANPNISGATKRYLRNDIDEYVKIELINTLRRWLPNEAVPDEESVLKGRIEPYDTRGELIDALLDMRRF